MPSLLVSIDVRASGSAPVSRRTASRATPSATNTTGTRRLLDPAIPVVVVRLRAAVGARRRHPRRSPTREGPAGRHRPARAALRPPSHPLSRSRCSPRPVGRRCRRRNAGSSSAGLGVVTHAFVDGDHGELAALDGEHAVHRGGRKGDRNARRRGTRRRGACCRRPARSPACADSRASTRRNLTPAPGASASSEIRSGLAPAVDATAASRGWTAGSRPALRRVDMGTSGPLILPGFFIGLTAGALVLTSLYNGTGGSILAVAVWHAS